MIDKEKVVKHLKVYVDCYDNRHSMCEPDCALYGHGDCAKYVVEYISAALDLLKEQEDQIERLEYDLAVTQNNLNYYVNGND